jgi:hypothetical protein
MDPRPSFSREMRIFGPVSGEEFNQVPPPRKAESGLAFARIASRMVSGLRISITT